MTIVLRIISSKTGRHITKTLKNGMNDIALPDGTHIEVIDESGQHLLRPRSADHAHGKLVLDYQDGDSIVQLGLRGELVDQLDGDGPTHYRLAGPGLDATKSYPWAEVHEKLSELATLMNFAWRQSRQGRQELANPPSNPDDTD